MLSVSSPAVANQVTFGPDFPAGPTGGRRLAAPALMLGTIALGLLALGQVEVAHERGAVELELAGARTAATLVATHLQTGDGEALGADLDRLTRSAEAAGSGSSGINWRMAAILGPHRDQIRALRRDAERVQTLAAAAGPLRDTLAPLVTVPGATPSSAAGVSRLYALDDLARSLSRYATAAGRSGDPSAAALEDSAVAAGLLPGLAGADGPRDWTVCRAAAGPCIRVSVTNARSGAPRVTENQGPVSPPGRRWSADLDLLVIGVDPGALFQTGGTLDAAAVFGVLSDLRPADPAGSGTGAEATSVTVRSAVPAEQLVIDRLSRH